MALKILVTGSNGQLGSELQACSASYPQLSFTFYTRQDFPVDDAALAQSILKEQQADVLINCAAYTAVDRAETETEEAFRINGTGVGQLARICREQGTRFIHISTDYVFNGRATDPLKESEATDPVNAYGASKLKGEELALKENSEALIIRTSWVYSFFGKNFVKTMMRLMKEKESIRVVSDQVGSPTYAADLAEAILRIILSGKWVPGIFNFSNEGVISWYDFALEIKELTGSTCAVLPVSSDQYPTPARRPKYSVLDKTKITTTYPVSLKNWKTSLKQCISRLQADPAGL